MAEWAAAALAEWALASGPIAAFDAAIFISNNAAIINTAALMAANYGLSAAQARKAQAQARDAYNSSQVNRLANVSDTLINRELVLGRVRKGGGIFFKASTGIDNAKFVMCIALAGHEIDAVEQIYMNDVPVTLDGSGYVQDAPYVDTDYLTGYAGLVGYGTTIVLPNAPIAGSIVATVNAGEGQTSVVVPTSIVGTTLTFAANPEYTSITYQYSSGKSFARIRWMLGSASQSADATLISLFPALWTSNHRACGVPYLICEFDYNEKAFPSGVPAVSAVIRGAKLFDPRSPGSAPAWSENPALMQRHILTHPNFGKRTSIRADEDARIAIVAAACDVVQGYTVAGVTTAQALYKAALVLPYGAVPRGALDDLASAMAGRWAHVQGQFFCRAGVYSSSIQTLTDVDFVGSGRATVGAAAGSAISINSHKARTDKFNVVQTRIYDAGQNFKEVPLAPLKAFALITRDGSELVQELSLQAVSFAPQALHVAGVLLRDSRDPLVCSVTCKLTAYQIQLTDVVAVTLPRFGWVAKEFEVTSRKWTLGGLIKLTLKETAASIFTPDAAFVPGGYATNSVLPSPWVIAAPVLNAATSGTAELFINKDGFIESRVRVTWAPLTNLAVTQSGQIELQWQVSGAPTTSWQVETIAGNASELIIRNAPDGVVIIIRARSRSNLAVSQWSVQQGHRVVGKTAAPSAPATLTGTVSRGVITWIWPQIVDADYDNSELRSTNANWGLVSPAPLFKGAATTFSELVAVAGTVTRHLRSADTTKNMSSVVSGSITVATADLVTLNALGYTGDLNASATITLVNAGNMTIAGSSAAKTSGGAAWNASVYSKDGFSGGAFVSFVAPAGNFDVMIGLAASPTPSTSFDFSHAMYLAGGADLTVYRDGSSIGSIGTYTAGDVLAVAYDGVTVRYLKNGVALGGAGAYVLAYTGPLYLDSSFHTQGLIVTNLQFGPMSSNDFAAVGGATKPDNNATVGARAGTNLLDAAGGQLNDAAIKNSAVSVSATGGLLGGGGGQVTSLPTVDLGNGVFFGARNRNDPPSDYPVGNTHQFKDSATVGLSGGGFCTLETIKQFPNSSGGGIYQYAYQGLLTYRRYAADPEAALASAWGAWAQDLDRNAYTGDLNATVGATWGNNIGGQPGDTDLMNTHYAQGVGVVDHPAGGVFNGGTILNGALKIRLPQSWTNTMLRFYIEVYEYNIDSSLTIEVGGYNYPEGAQPSGGRWVNAYAKQVGGINSVRTVRFGNDGVRCCVWLGELTGGAAWSYPVVTVTGFRAGYAYTDTAYWKSGWSVTMDNTGAWLDSTHHVPDAASNTFTNPLSGANWAQIPMGNGKAADNATINLVTYGAEPASPQNGHLWVDTTGPFQVFKLRSAGAWVTGAGNAPSVRLNLTNNSWPVPADVLGIITSANYAAATTVATVIQNEVDVTGSWTLSKTDGPGVSTTQSGVTFSLSSLTSDSSYVDITATRSGFATQVYRLAASKVKSAAANNIPGGWSAFADDVRVGNGLARAGILLQPNGAVIAKAQNGSDTQVESWYLPNTASVGAGYVVKIVQLDYNGGGILGLLLNTWYELSADREWYVSTSITGISSATALVYIAKVGATGQVLATAQIEMNAEKY